MHRLVLSQDLPSYDEALAPSYQAGVAGGDAGFALECGGQESIFSDSNGEDLLRAELATKPGTGRSCEPASWAWRVDDPRT
jgi:hypothetical protein